MTLHVRWTHPPRRRDLEGIPERLLKSAENKKVRRDARHVANARRFMKAKQDQCDDRCTQHDENTIHGRPASRWRAWQEIGAPRRVIRWLRRGVPIMWLTRPPRPYRFAPVAFSPEQEAWFVKERDRFYASGAWAPARQRTHVSPAFLVEKPDKPDGTKDWRLVVNLKFLNRYCRQLRLRYDTLKALRTMARRNEYMFALDVKDGYYHLRLQESEEHFMTFSVVIAGEIQYITCVGLPMGWQHSAYYFVHLMRVVVRHLRAPELAEELRKVRELRKSGALPRILQRQLKAPQDQHRLRILAYVDAFLFLAPTREEALQAMRQVDDLFLRLGVQKHPTKFTPEPVQQLVHLGMDVDLESGRFRVTKKRCAQLRAQAKDLICRATRHQRWVPAKELASFAGLANACLLAVEPARFFLRSIYVALETRSSWEGNCRLDRQALRDLSWWNAFHYEHKWNGAAIWKRPTQAILHCDAAGGKQHGWGGALNGKHTARGAWTPAQAEQHITLLELKAVRFTIETFVHFLRGRVVRLHEDNMGVVGILASSTSKSPKIMREMRKLWWLLDANGIQLQDVEYIRSEANVLADALSRERVHPLLRPLRRSFISYVEDKWQRRHTVDRFATFAGAVAPRYYTIRHCEPQAEGVGAFTTTWRREVNFARPPPNQISAVIRLLQQDPAVSATVVVPYWPGAMWFAPLMALTTASMVLPWTAIELGTCVSSATRPWNVIVCRVGPDQPGCI